MLHFIGDKHALQDIDRTVRARSVIETAQRQRFPQKYGKPAWHPERLGVVARLVEAWRYRNRKARESEQLRTATRQALHAIEQASCEDGEEERSEDFVAGFKAGIEQAADIVSKINSDKRGRWRVPTTAEWCAANNVGKPIVEATLGAFHALVAAKAAVVFFDLPVAFIAEHGERIRELVHQGGEHVGINVYSRDVGGDFFVKSVFVSATPKDGEIAVTAASEADARLIRDHFPQEAPPAA